MKTKNPLLILCAILLLSFSGIAYGQAKVITITLYVNTASVDSGNTDQTCNFGQAEGIINRKPVSYALSSAIFSWCCKADYCGKGIISRYGHLVYQFLLFRVFLYLMLNINIWYDH